MQLSGFMESVVYDLANEIPRPWRGAIIGG